MAANNICIVGAGAIGLTTAWQVTEKFPGAKVTVYADKFTTETTSHGAAGIFMPQLCATNAPNFDQLCADSWSFFNALVKSPEARKAGISIIDGYQFNTRRLPLDDETFRKWVYHFAEIPVQQCSFLTEDVASTVVQAYHWTTLLIECRRFLPWMTSKLESKSVKFEKRLLYSLEDLAPENFDLIFNCAGLGNRSLIDDANMYPVRGQLVRVRAPWIKQFYGIDENCYIIPGGDEVVLGGSFLKGREDMAVDTEVRDGILERCKRLIPSLVDAEIDHEWVGLRPYRHQVRIEKGLLVAGSRVYHNYGHGCNGIGLSMGSAVAVVNLALQAE